MERFKQSSEPVRDRGTEKIQGIKRIVYGYDSRGFRTEVYYNEGVFYTLEEDLEIDIFVWEDKTYLKGTPMYDTVFNSLYYNPPAFLNGRKLIIVVDTKAQEYLAYNKKGCILAYHNNLPVEDVLLWRYVENEQDFKYKN